MTSHNSVRWMVIGRAQSVPEIRNSTSGSGESFELNRGVSSDVDSYICESLDSRCS